MREQLYIVARVTSNLILVQVMSDLVITQDRVLILVQIKVTPAATGQATTQDQAFTLDLLEVILVSNSAVVQPLTLNPKIITNT